MWNFGARDIHVKYRPTENDVETAREHIEVIKPPEIMFELILQILQIVLYLEFKLNKII